MVANGNKPHPTNNIIILNIKKMEKCLIKSPRRISCGMQFDKDVKDTAWMCGKLTLKTP